MSAICKIQQLGGEFIFGYKGQYAHMHTEDELIEIWCHMFGQLHYRRGNMCPLASC